MHLLEAKKRKLDQLRRKKFIAAQTKYADALTYIDMFHSPACWMTKADARREFGKLASKTAKLNTVKEQIRIRVLGFGWDDLHHAWSEGGVDFTPE